MNGFEVDWADFDLLLFTLLNGFLNFILDAWINQI